jgi:HEAT repeat protein
MDEFKSELDKMIAQNKEAIAFSARFSAELASRSQSKLVEMAGSTLDRMRRSPAEAIAFLEDSDWKIRWAAIQVLRDNWGLQNAVDVTLALKKTALTDPTARVRAAAFAAISKLYERTDEPRIGKLLASVVLNENEPYEVRCAAHNGLHVLRGLAVPTWPGLAAIPPTPFRIPEDIDWDFIRSYL